MLKAWQFRELNEDVGGGLFDKMIHLVALVENSDYDNVSKRKPKDLISSYKDAQQKSRLKLDNKTQIVIDDKKLTLMDFKLISFGQFISLESLINDGEKKNVTKIAASLYLQTIGGEMSELEYEPYDKINVEYRAKKIDNIPINDIWGAITKYLKFRQFFFDSYEIFGDPYKDVVIENLNEEETEIYNEDMKARSKTKGREYENILNILSKNDITKFESILKLNLFLCFNQLAFLQSETD